MNILKQGLIILSIIDKLHLFPAHRRGQLSSCLDLPAAQCAEQCWALSIFLNLFNNKKLFLALFIKLI